MLDGHVEQPCSPNAKGKAKEFRLREQIDQAPCAAGANPARCACGLCPGTYYHWDLCPNW